jgi:hypothetical protein
MSLPSRSIQNSMSTRHLALLGGDRKGWRGVWDDFRNWAISAA